MGLGMWWCHARKRWAGIFGYFEKSSLLRFGPGRVQLGLRDVLRMVGSDGTVSIVKIVSLSPRVEKRKSQEGNKSFVPEPKESSVFRGIPIYVYFTYMNISHIVLWLYYTSSSRYCHSCPKMSTWLWNKFI